MHRKMKTNEGYELKQNNFITNDNAGRVRLNFLVEVISSTFVALLVYLFCFSLYKIQNTTLIGNVYVVHYNPSFLNRQ